MCPNVFCRRKVVFLYFSLENFLIFFTTRLKNQIFEFFYPFYYNSCIVHTLVENSRKHSLEVKLSLLVG